jgi:hypothetical protein
MPEMTLDETSNVVADRLIAANVEKGLTAGQEDAVANDLYAQFGKLMYEAARGGQDLGAVLTTGITELDRGVWGWFKRFGEAVFDGWSEELYKYVCGADSEQVDKWIEGGMALLIPSVAGLIVTGIGVAPAIAAVLAGIIVTVFWKGMKKGGCTLWKAKLPAEP